MEKWNLIFGILGGVIAICTAIGSFAAWFVKIQITSLSNQVAALQREVHEYKDLFSKLDDRQRQHTGNTDKHISAAWRQELNDRLARIESGLTALLARD